MDEARADAALFDPVLDLPRYELGTVVALHESRLAVDLQLLS